MCGIVGYIGKRESTPILLKGLERLEYRGYDSAGVALMGTSLSVVKKKGKVGELKAEVSKVPHTENVGIGHTRWATHGEPSDRNAHPHLSQDGSIALVHNGIIENYAVLKEMLMKRGHTFASDTDTEVLVHLIGDIQDHTKSNLQESVRLALTEVIGAYAIAVISNKEPDLMVVAKKGSPLAIGIGNEKGEFFVASDATPIIEYTRNVVYLKDGEVAALPRDGEISIVTLANEIQSPYIEELTLSLDVLEKGGFPHFMLKEIFEQPNTVRDSMRGRISLSEGRVVLGGIREYETALVNAKRIVMVACGTSLYAAMEGERLFEEFARIPVEVEYASEFRYRNPIIDEGDIVIAISQSGETADTLAAIELAKKEGAIVLGVTNVVGSSIARATDAGSYTHAGPEIGVASTKAFTAQVTVLTLMAIHIALKKGTMPQSRLERLLTELDIIPDQIAKVLKKDSEILQIAKKWHGVQHALFLGRGYSMPVALEGALKLKEISYIHAEGYPAGEMKHGPIALIEPSVPAFVIATKSAQYEKMVSNIQEIKARGGPIIAVVTEGDTIVRGLANDVIEIPEVDEALSPILATIPLQLLAYHTAVLRGTNVDQPRNLAKSVTVE